MKYFCGSVVFVLLFSFSLRADWPMFGGNRANSAAADAMVPRDLAGATIVSSGPIGCKDSSSPVIENGRVYVYCAADTNSAIRCLDGTSLDSIWTAPVPVADFGWGSWGSPAVGSSSIVFAADAFLGCWNLDGSLRWSMSMDHQTVNSSPLLVEDRIYIGAFSYMNAEGGIGCYDLATGSQLWFSAVINNSTFSSCSPATLSETVAGGTGYACCSNQLWQFSLESGATLWQQTLPGKALNNVSLAAPDTVLVVNYDFMYGATNLFACDTSGNFLWGAECGMSDMPPAIYQDSSGQQLCIHTAGDSGVPAALSAFDLTSGTSLWRSTLAGNNANMPVISRDVVYAARGRYNGWVFAGMTNLTAFDVYTGSPLPSSGPVPGGLAPAIDSDTLYTADDGVLYAYQWPVTPLTARKIKARVKLLTVEKDTCKLIASVPSAVLPTNWLSGATELDLRIGGINIFQKINDTYIVKTDNARRLVFKYTSGDRTSRATMKWKAKTGIVKIKALMKKHNLQAMLQQIPAADGISRQEIAIGLSGEDHCFDAGATVSVPVKSKRDKIIVKYKL